MREKKKDTVININIRTDNERQNINIKTEKERHCYLDIDMNTLMLFSVQN